MFRQIEKIQQMVNTLLGHCAEAGADVAPDHSTHAAKDQKYESLGVMILKAQDGDLPRRSVLEMKRLLLNDASALNYYVDFQELTVQLHMHYNPVRFQPRLSCEAGAPV